MPRSVPEERLEAAARVAHELNNLYSVIGGLAALIRSVAYQPDQVERYADEVRCAVACAAELTRTLQASIDGVDDVGASVGRAARGRPDTATILLVELDPDARRLAAQALGGAGHDVVALASVEEARVVIDCYSAPIHLLLSGVDLEEAGGEGLRALFSARHPRARALSLRSERDGVERIPPGSDLVLRVEEALRGGAAPRDGAARPA